MTRRYHVYIGKERRRTTISLDTIVSDYLGLHLGHDIDGDGTHSAVRGWLQAEIDRDSYADRIHLSQWLAARAFVLLARADLNGRYGAWLDQQMRKPGPLPGGRIFIRPDRMLAKPSPPAARRRRGRRAA